MHRRVPPTLLASAFRLAKNTADLSAIALARADRPLAGRGLGFRARRGDHATPASSLLHMTPQRAPAHDQIYIGALLGRLHLSHPGCITQKRTIPQLADVVRLKDLPSPGRKATQ
jgi:hypothetical protein